MHKYLSYEYEQINVINLRYVQILIEAFEARKVVKAQAAAHAKPNKPTRRGITNGKKLLPLIDDNDIDMEDGLITRKDGELTNPLDTP